MNKRPLESVVAPETKNTEESQPTKKQKKPGNQKKFKDQVNTPDGIRAEGKLHPWPAIDHEWNVDTIYIDEAGMGCYAGPLHIGGTVLLSGFNVQGLHDSKLLSEHERKKAFEALLASPHIIHHVEIMSNVTIDELKLGGAWKQGIRNLIAHLKQKAWDQHKLEITRVVLDGDKDVPDVEVPIVRITKADRLYAGVSAASILAKVTRDTYMMDIAKDYKEQGFYEIFYHGKGYRWKPEHDNLVKQRVFTDLHRKSFNPLRTVLEN